MSAWTERSEGSRRLGVRSGRTRWVELSKGLLSQMVLFNYTDYRLFLKDYYESQKTKHLYFSYRYFSRLAGLGSPSYLRMVFDGRRNLSSKSIIKFTKALKLNKREAAYFENLVLYTQAKTEKEKDLYFERLVALKPHKQITGLQKDQFEYVSKKYLVTLREMVALPHFREDDDWIGNQLNPPVKPSEIKKGIELLIRLKLLKRDENNRLKLTSGIVKSPPDVESLDIFAFHRAILSEAKDAILNIPYDHRELTSLTIAMSFKQIYEVKSILRRCHEEIANAVNKNKGAADEIFQINMQLFPVTNTRRNRNIK